jgi:hypothetical protein
MIEWQLCSSEVRGVEERGEGLNLKQCAPICLEKLSETAKDCLEEMSETAEDSGGTEWDS